MINSLASQGVLLQPLNRPAAYIIAPRDLAKRLLPRLHAALCLVALVRREGRLAAKLDTVRDGASAFSAISGRAGPS